MWPAKGGGAAGGVLLPLGVGLPPFLVGLGLEGEGVEEKEERGAPPPSLSNSDWGGRGARLPLVAPPLLH